MAEEEEEEEEEEGNFPLIEPAVQLRCRRLKTNSKKSVANGYLHIKLYFDWWFS